MKGTWKREKGEEGTCKRGGEEKERKNRRELARFRIVGKGEKNGA